MFVIVLAAVGYERGLVASALPLAGFVAGAALGARLGPALLADGAESKYAPLVAVAGGLILGCVAAVVLDGFARRVSDRIASRGARVVDGLGGSLICAALALLIAWAFGAVALHASGVRGLDLRGAVQRSAILGALNNALPPSGPLLNVLRRVDPTPRVRGPDARVRAPDPAGADDPDVRAAGGSSVRVLGTACGLGVEGSGWVAAPNLVVTAAHVVAGEDDTTVSVAGGSELDATAVHYDTQNDLAVLSVAGLEAQPLDFAEQVRKGTDAVVIGYPENGPLTFTPARMGRTGTVTSEDSYGRGPVQREITPFRAAVHHGNSGGPVVDLAGDVVATVFAASAGNGPENGLGVPNRVVAQALGGKLDSTDTGPCAA